MQLTDPTPSCSSRKEINMPATQYLLKNYVPYTYLIGWSSHQVYYYGTEYGSNTKVANPNNLWKTYFTSSKRVASFREKYGEPDIIQVRKTFERKEEAVNWEHKVLKRLKVKTNPMFLNCTSGDGNFVNKGGYTCPKNHGEKISEYRSRPEIIEKSSKNATKINNKRVENGTHPFLKENRTFEPVRMVGEKNGMYGRKRTEEEKRKISESVKKATSSEAWKKNHSEKAKNRCTEEWKARVAENNKRQLCCVKCGRQMGISSLGRHQKGKRCLPLATL